MPSWDSAAADDPWTEACGKGRWPGPTETLEQNIRGISNARLWQFRTAASKSLVEYARDDEGVPTAWVARMRESMARLTPRFCASRTVREYTEQHYLPSAAAYQERAANKGAVGARMLKWRQALDEKWAGLRFGEVKVETKGGQHLFEVQVYLNDLDPTSVRVELYADGIIGGSSLRQEMKRVRQLGSASGGYVYSATVPAARPAGHYSARVIPDCSGVAVPLEAAHILWQS